MAANVAEDVLSDGKSVLKSVVIDLANVCPPRAKEVINYHELNLHKYRYPTR